MLTSTLKERGAIAILIALYVVVILTAGTVVLSGVLNQQIRLSQDVVATERALYAANSGFEHVLYARFRQGSDASQPVTVSGEIIYDDTKASYEGMASFTADNQLCGLGEGTFKGLVRRLAVGSRECTFER